MARGDCRLGTWQVLLTISMVIIPLSAHGRHSLTRRTHHHHNNHSSSDNMEVLTAKMALSEDSAERDHLIGAGGGGLGLALGAKLPLSSSTKRHHAHKQHARLDFVDEDPPLGEELTAGGAGPDQPGNPLSDDVINVEFHSPPPDTAPQDVALDWAKAPQPQPQKQKAGGDPTAWTLSDFYDYLSPDDDLSAVDVTPEPEPSPSAPADMEDENPLLAGSPAPTDKVKPDVDMVGQTSPPAPPMQRPGNGDELSLSGAMGADGCRLGYVRSGPGVCVSQCDVEANFCFNGGVCTVVAGMGAFCRCNVQEYIWNKGTRCDWAVTEFQVLCVVVGVASTVLILLLMIVIFFAKRLHRLKNENKRLRKRSKYRPHSSEPQTDGLSVSTTADGSQPNVRKLCDTPPPAPQAHTHNLAYYDNIISQRPPTTSYTWEYKPTNPYNHFQDEPHKKQQDPGKCPLAKEEGSMNILNSHSPKHENNRPTSMGHDLGGHTPNNTTEENAEDGVTIGLEVLLPKDAKRQVDTSPPLQYDLFLYKVGNNGDYTSPGQAPPTQNANSYPSSHPLPKSPKTPKSPKSPKVHKSPRHTTEKHSGSNREASSSGRHSSPGRHPMSGKHSSPGRRPSPNRHPSLNHNHSPGHHPSPNRHPSPSRHPSTNRHASPGRHPSPGRHRSPSRHSVVPGYKCQPNPSSSTTTPPQLRRPRGRSQPPGSEHSGAGADYQSAHNMRPSPSSPHLTQPPPSPSRLKYSPVSTRSLPQLS